MLAQTAPLFILSKQSIASRTKKAMRERERRKKNKESKQEEANLPPHPRLQQAVRNAPPKMGRGSTMESSIAMECLPTLECGPFHTCGTVDEMMMRDSMGHEGKEREEIGKETPFQLVIDGMIINGECHVEKSGEDQRPPQCK